MDGVQNRTRPSPGSNPALLRGLGLGLYLSELSLLPMNESLRDIWTWLGGGGEESKSEDSHREEVKVCLGWLWALSFFLKPSQNKSLHAHPRHWANGVGYCAGTGKEIKEEIQPCPQTLHHLPWACPLH